MTTRAKGKTAVAKPTAKHQIASVSLGHYALLADGRTVRVAAIINGAIFVRYSDDAPRTGPVELAATTPVLDIIAPELVASDRGEVKDPVAA